MWESFIISTIMIIIRFHFGQYSGKGGKNAPFFKMSIFKHFIYYQTIKDYQLLGVVCGMIAIIVSILVVWEIVGPQRLIRKELTNEVSQF